MSYDPATALELARLIQAAYALALRPEAPEPLTLAAAGWEVGSRLYVRDIDGYRPFGFLAWRGRTLAVILRGTENAFEVLQDVLFGHTPLAWLGPGCCAERGFADFYATLRTGPSDAAPRLALTLRGQLARDRLLIAGHSLGGALATMLAAELALLQPAEQPVEVYTFGSPRTGNKAFAGRYDQLVPATYRVANLHDLVPCLPSEWAGFSHVDELVSINPADRAPHGLTLSHSIDTYAALLAGGS